MPFFRRSDLEMLGKMAAVARAHGLGTFPESGYSIAYEEVPLSSDEMEAMRTQAEWDLQQGFVSKPRLYARRHGISVEDAIAELRKVQAENAMIEPPEDDSTEDDAGEAEPAKETAETETGTADETD